MKRSLTFVTALVASTAAFGLLVALRASAPLVPSNTWAATGDMAQPRAGASAALFPGGRVLITGGIDEHGAVLATAERYSPTGGGFPGTPPIQAPPANPTSAPLPHGRHLV